jgi:hypothetical protein
MQYLGRIIGDGTLTANGETIDRADYEIDGFLKAKIGVSGSGEIRASADALRRVFGRRDVQIVTGDGRHIDVRFSDRKMTPGARVAHVELSGALPTARADWRR